MLINQIYDIVVSSLEKELYSNAVFFGERLLSENDSEDFRYLLAKSYMGKTKYF